MSTRMRRSAEDPGDIMARIEDIEEQLNDCAEGIRHLRALLHVQRRDRTTSSESIRRMQERLAGLGGHLDQLMRTLEGRNAYDA